MGLPTTIATAGARTVVLVEGASDRRAVEALATRWGRDLATEGVAVVTLGGAGNLRSAVERFGPQGQRLRMVGLCDAGEAAEVARVLHRAGLGDGSRDGLEALGFFVSDRDLEDELIRAAGPAAVEQVVTAEGELRALRTLQKQGPWAGRPLDRQLHRFLGAKGGRKERYAGLLVDALDLARAPRPLVALLDAV